MEVYRKFGIQQQTLAKARRDGRSTQYLEEMWMLDLCLSTNFVEPTSDEVDEGSLKPFRLPPWDRFEPTLKSLGLNALTPEKTTEALASSVG